MQPESVFLVHTPSSILFGALVGAGSLWPQSREVKIYDSKLRVQRKGALLQWNSVHIHSWNWSLQLCLCPLHGLLLNYSLGGEEDSALSPSLTLSHSLSLSLLNCIITYGNRAKLAMLIGLEKDGKVRFEKIWKELRFGGLKCVFWKWEMRDCMYVCPNMHLGNTILPQQNEYISKKGKSFRSYHDS